MKFFRNPTRRNLAVLVLFLEALAFASSFVRTIRTDSFYQRPPVSPFGRRSATSDDSNSGNDDNNNSNNNEDDWSLEQDWLLIDRVPGFTVGADDENRRTFWTQLWISTPELARRADGPETLRERYESLRANANADDDGDDRLPPVGPSPDVLQDWSVDENGSRFSGTLDDGRSVWFAAQVVGRLEEDVGTTSSSSGFADFDRRPGGYVEAVGNRVYELGTPRRRLDDEVDAVKTTMTTVERSEDASASFSLANAPTWIPSTSVAAVSAFFATALLSASVGFGAGLGIVADNAASATSTSTTNLMRVSDPSTSEMRARTEARVLFREREVRLLNDRLDRDRIRLETLGKEERSATTATTTTDASLNEPSVAERRASVEARVMRSERMLDAVTRRLATDKVELQKYRTGENALLR